MFHIYLCDAVLSLPCSLVVTCCERAGLLALLWVVRNLTNTYKLCFPNEISAKHRKNIQCKYAYLAIKDEPLVANEKGSREQTKTQRI